MNSGHGCPLCGGGETFPKYDFGRQRILRCRQCTMMWLDPQPSLEELGAVYGEDYYQNEKFFEDRNESIYGYYDYLSEKYFKQHNYHLLLDRLIGFMADFGSDSRLLDVGCGLGSLLDVAFDKGFQVEGVEFNRTAAEQVRRKYTFPVFTGDLLDYEGGPFDVVAMLDVIEHLREPFQAIRMLNRLLKPGGVMMLSTMDCDSLVSRLLGKRLEDFRRVREHLFFFTRRTMGLVLEAEGFEVLRTDSYGIPIRMDFLAQRVRLTSRSLGAVFGKAVQTLHLSSLQFNFDPHTKMVIYARKVR